MIRLTQNDWRIFRRLRRKHGVSTDFLRYNLENIEKFIWFETWPRIVIRRYAIRKENRVFIIHNRLRRVLFDQSNRKIFKRMRQNIKQWSKRIVAWQKNHLGIKEYVEEVVYEDKSKASQLTVAEDAETACGTIEDVSKQLKEQLELLKNGRRPQPLIKNVNVNTKETKQCSEHEKLFADKDLSGSHEEKLKSDSNNVDDVRIKLKEQLRNITSRRDNTAPLDIRSQESVVPDKEFDEYSAIETQGPWQINLESTPEKQITTQENVQPVKQLDTDEKTEKSQAESSTQPADKLKTGLNFLDMLMCKVSGSTVSNNCINHKSPCNLKTSPCKEKETLQRTSSSTSMKESYQHHHEHSMDSTDEFLGFDDCERIPGMLMTPIVPHSSKNGKNSVFVSESLNEYMRINDLETNYNIDEDRSVTKGKIFARDMEGLMTPKTKPPHFDMPAVPENLLKFRTVAERKQYLQKFSKNYRLAIINNEAIIYRELQRRMRIQKVKSASQILAQSSNSSMSFTRNGWNAASFVNTEFNKYYYQILDVDHGTFKVRLRGARGNNDEFNKTPYVSRVTNPSKECSDYCADDKVWQYLKPIKTVAEKTKKLNSSPLPSVFKPCPLSHKTFQKPLDDDTAALLLAGGSMAVVRMPTVELEVFPEYGKPLHEIAKRYLQYILPHHDISREWAEFSVSTLQQPKTLKEAEQAAAKSFNSRDLRKSFTFVIPYLNDRNHILVRRVVDRSEKLDRSFEQCIEEEELVPKTDFSFRQNLDMKDNVLLTCADVVSDMINTVAISCSENSFIKIDPDGLIIDEVPKNKMADNCKLDTSGLETSVSLSPNNTILSGGNAKKQKKQNSLLLELKRLNATIIDAAVKQGNDKKPCSKDYCQMGCICVSLEEIVPVREHCGKTKCMLECTCKASNQSRIMRLETDGRTLTTEDAFMLRRKATARLARMEKEFTSTIVLTENETLLINETNNDKKRRCTKAPKRYEDFTDTEDEQRRNSPKKTALTTIDKEKHLATEIKEVHDPVYVKDTILEQLKHCTVDLVPLRDMDNIAPWCMVHNLYKCFCKGRAVEGKPVIIEKEDPNTTVVHDAVQKMDFDYNVSVKAKYTFDKVEIKKNIANNYNDDRDEDEECYNDNADNEDFDEEDQNEKDDDDDDDWLKERKRKYKDSKEVRAEKPLEQAKAVAAKAGKTDEDSEETGEDEEYTSDFPIKPCAEMPRSKRSLHDVRKRFYSPRLDSCRRHIPTPRRMFLYCNRRRRLSVLKYIKDNENDQTRLLLNEHVMRSVYYHKIDTENHKKTNISSSSKEKFDSVEKSNSQVPQPITAAGAECLLSTDVTKRKFLLVNEVVDLIEDEEQTNISNASNKNKDDNSQMSSSSTKSCSSFEKLLPETESADEPTKHFQICSSGNVITVKKFATLTDLKRMNQNKSIASASTTPADQHKPIAPASTTPTNQNESTVPASVTPAVKEPAEEKEVEADSDTGVDELKLPKIASCFSLNVKANVSKHSSNAALNKDQCLDFSSATSVHSAAFSQNQNQEANNSPNPLSAGTVTSKDAGSAFVLDMDNENVRDVYNSVIKTMNSLVSKKMQDIDCALQRESHIIPTPNADILCIMKWCNFLEAFWEGFAYVWQVKMKDSTYLVVTIQNIMPLIMGAMGIVNITALKAEKLPLLGRMLLQKFRNKETEKLAVVMQGKQSHWVAKGFLKSDPTTACNKPTPDSHPTLTKKINVLCSLLVKQRQKEQKKKDKLTSQRAATIPQVKPPTQNMIAPTQVPPQPQPKPLPPLPRVAQILPTRRIVKIPPTTSQQTQNQVSFVQPTPQSFAPQICPQNDTDVTEKSIKKNEIESRKVIAKISSRKRKMENAQSTSLLKMDSYSKMSSNIDFRSVTQSDIDEIYLPELHKLDHKWLVLDLHNDFSHIFVPDFRDLVSLDRIQKVINFARQKSKIVKLQFFQNAPFDAFVTPKSVRKIYFGPLTTNMKAPTLILLQSVDGQMMLRELYQLQHNIVTKPEEKTKAFWLVHLKGQTHFEMDVSLVNKKATVVNVLPASSSNNSLTIPDTSITTTAAESATKNPNEEGVKIVTNDNDADEDDEDCMIIDDIVQNSSTKDTIRNILPQTNTPIASLLAQPSVTPAANNVYSPIPAINSQPLLKVPNTNTIIKPLNCSKSLGSVVVNIPSIPATNKPLPTLTLPPNTIITGISPCTPMTNVTGTGIPVVNIQKNAIITGMESAPPEAPYSSTIFITSSTSSSATSVAATTTSTATIGSTKITSKPVEKNQLQANELKPACNKQSTNLIRQALEAGVIKRRRISLFCPNKYDKISQNLAVDAVIRKILPENAEDIQINPVGEESNASFNNPDEVVTSVVATQNSQITSQSVSNILQTSLVSSTNTTATAVPKTPITTRTPTAPIVFGVNFMDDGDEPTASIVIKPNSSTASSLATSSAPSKTLNCKPIISRPTVTNAPISAPITSSSVCVNTNSNTPKTTGTLNEPPTKKIKLPTLFNTPAAVTVATNATVVGKGKVVNPTFCTNIAQQTNIVPKFSAPRPIAPKLNCTLSSSLSSPSADNSLTATPFPFRRSSISLKVQKIVSSSAAATMLPVKSITTTATITTNQPSSSSSSSSSTLTVKQVQDMLSKPCINVAAIKPTTSSPSMPLQLLPTIKATITPAKATTITATSTTFTPAASTIVSSGSVVSSTSTAVQPIVTPAPETTSLNSTLTISKVQSFGSPQKPHNPDKNLQTFIPPSTQIVINDSSDKVPIPTPPSHIQYGYIVSPDHPNQKFVAKRVAEEFYIKVPSVGILKLQGLGSVNNYLNKYINKILKETQAAPAIWQFMAASKAVQMQNHQKSLLVRKTKSSGGGNTGTSKNIATSLNNSLEEPILIDD